jgi:hypothetical protein
MSNSTTSTWIDPALDPNNQYGYYPSKPIGILFVVLFAISTSMSYLRVYLAVLTNNPVSYTCRSSNLLPDVVAAPHRVPLWCRRAHWMEWPSVVRLQPGRE